MILISFLWCWKAFQRPTDKLYTISSVNDLLKFFAYFIDWVVTVLYSTVLLWETAFANVCFQSVTCHSISLMMPFEEKYFNFIPLFLSRGFMALILPYVHNPSIFVNCSIIWSSRLFMYSDNPHILYYACKTPILYFLALRLLYFRFSLSYEKHCQRFIYSEMIIF